MDIIENNGGGDEREWRGDDDYAKKGFYDARKIIERRYYYVFIF